MKLRTLLAILPALAAGAAHAQSAQSPVDLDAPVHRASALTGRYPAAPAIAFNNGHTVQVQAAEGGTLSVAGHGYGLVQFHFHWPSEHLVKGDSFPAEIHMVHRDSAGKLAVLGTLVRLSAADNPAWNDFFARIPAEGDTVRLALLDVASLFGLSGLDGERVFHYAGSLTTAPFTEGVEWLVRERPVEMSAAQLEKLRAVMHHPYAREVQPLNGREIELLEGAMAAH